MPFDRLKLSRAIRIIRTPKRWSEIGWRILFRVFWSNSILRQVRRTYASAGGPDAELLRRNAKIAWGDSRGNVARARGYTYVACQLSVRLAGEQCSLEAAPIGFEDLKIHARTTDGNSSRVYLNGFDDESTSLFEVYRRKIVPGTIAVDVGANIGIHTLVLSRCVQQNGHVNSYEPNRTLCERFRENMMLNDIQNATLYNAGVGSIETVSRFQPREGEFNIGLGRFDPNGPVEIAVVKLDSDLHVSSRISLIKVDVEGMELDVVRGARAILAQHRPALVLECNLEWTLRELRDQIPYPVTIHSIPVTLLEQPRNLDRFDRYHDAYNILVEPLS